MSQCILVADDDPVILRLVSLSLNAADFEVVGVTNGEDALKMIRARKTAVAILDLQMPGKDGLSVLRDIKANVATRNVPVMILTGERDKEQVRKALDSGAADYLVKPFDPDLLRERVNRLVVATRRIPPLVTEVVWEI